MSSVITIAEYKTHYPDTALSNIRDARLQTAINMCDDYLNAVTDFAIANRWDIGAGEQGAFTPEQKELIKRAYFIETQYIISNGMDFSQGSDQSSFGAQSSSSNRPKRDRVCKEALNCLQSAKIYNYVEFNGMSYKGSQGSCPPPYCPPCDPQERYVTYAVGDVRYIPQQVDKTIYGNKILMYDDQGRWMVKSAEEIIEVGDAFMSVEQDASMKHVWRFYNKDDELVGAILANQATNYFTIYPTSGSDYTRFYTSNIRVHENGADYNFYFPDIDASAGKVGGHFALEERLPDLVGDFLQFNPTSHPQQATMLTGGILYNGTWYILPQGQGGDATTYSIAVEINGQTGTATVTSDSYKAEIEAYKTANGHYPIIKLLLTVKVAGSVVQEGEYYAADIFKKNNILNVKFIVETLTNENELQVQQIMYSDTGTQQVAILTEFVTEEFDSGDYYDKNSADNMFVVKQEFSTLESQVNTNTSNISSLQSSKADTSALNAEIETRKQADITLQANIDTKASQSDLSNEISARQNADLLKQDKTDQGLATVAKTVVGAINETYALALEKGVIVISAEDNEDFASTEDQITVSGTITDTVGTTYNIADLPLGISIYVTETTYPDRWLSSLVEGAGTFNALSEKIDLSNYYNKGEVDTLLSNKATVAEVNELRGTLNTHTSNTNNPHSVTKTQVGLGNVDNTSDLNKPISTATQTALNSKANVTDIPTKVSELENDSDFITKEEADDTYFLESEGVELDARVEVAEETLTEITPKVDRALLTPLTTPTAPELVGIDTTNTQARVKIGSGLSYDTTTDTLSATGDIPTPPASGRYVLLSTDGEISWSDSDWLSLVDIEAIIIDNGIKKKCSSLIDSKICAVSGDITTDDGTTYPRSTFNLPLILNPNLTSINNSFLYQCSAFNQILTLPNSLLNIGTQFMNFCSSFSQQLVLPNSIKTIGDGFLANNRDFNQPITLPNSLTSIGGNFLRSCSDFNQPITLPNSLTSIGDDFLRSCSDFNQPITLPNSLTSIGGNFLMDCPSFNQPITLPNSLTSVSLSLLYLCDNMTSQINIQDLQASIFVENSSSLATTNSTAPMYQTGIEIVGTHKQDFLTRFPNSDVSPYRKLK